jgi:hypothetical protein
MEPEQVAVVIEPGIADLAESKAAVDDSTALDLLVQFANSSTVAGTVLGDEFSELATSFGKDRGLDGGGLWDQIYKLFEPRWHVKVGAEVVQLDLAVYYLVPPPSPGCRVTLSVESSRKGETNTTIKVAGIGGGAKTTLKFSESFARSVEAPELFTVSVPCVIERVEVRSGPGKGTTYLRTAGTRAGELAFAARPFVPPEPLAGSVELRSVDLRGATGSYKQGETIAEGTTWSATAGIKLAAIGVETEVGWTGTYESSVGLTYEMVAGHRYVSRAVKSLPVPVWSLEP